MKPGEMLAFYMRDIDTVELNRPFDRLPTRKAFEGERDTNPPGMLYAAKGRPFLGTTTNNCEAVGGPLAVWL